MDAWLLKFTQSANASPVTQPFGSEQTGDLACWTALDGPLRYVFRTSPPMRDLDFGVECVILHCIQRVVSNAGALPAAPYRYVVETDVTAECEDDFNVWYEQEHLPGLASVPGALQAQRYRADSGTPRYYACYDLASLDVFGSPSWLAVRATPWSSRVRPAFRNTRRTMFKRAP